MDANLLRLVTTTPHLAIPEFELHAGTNTVGRGASSDLCLDDPSISRVHATIEVGPDHAVVVTDRDSRNGTWIDDVRLASPTPVRPGQRVRFGKVGFVLTVTKAPTPEGTPTASRTVDAVDSSALVDDMLDEALAEFRSSVDEKREVSPTELLRALAAVFATPRAAVELRTVILEQVPRLVDADRALLLEFEGNAVTVQASTGASTSFSRHVVDWVVKKREATLFVDAPSDARLGEAMSIAESAVQCVIAAPLVVGSEVLGVLYVDNASNSRALSDVDLDVMVVLAGQAALALHNAGLQRLRHTYERYFPPRTTQRLLSGRMLADGPVPLEVTALFADLSNYTGLCERMQPNELVELLDSFFPPMAAIVFERGGMLEKYIGDAMLAAWGVPSPSPDDAALALDAARAMQAEARTLGLDVHIGLHTGRVAFTHLGTEEYLQLALIGDATTVASRVCGIAEPGEIVMTRATRDAANAAAEPLGLRTLRGRRAGLQLFRIR